MIAAWSAPTIKIGVLFSQFEKWVHLGPPRFEGARSIGARDK